MCFFFFKQKTAYEMRISDWSSDVCSSDLMNIFDWFEQKDPEIGSVFNRAMTNLSVKNTAIVLDKIDFSSYKIVADVGGGHGFLLTQVLQIGRASCRERVCQYV